MTTRILFGFVVVVALALGACVGGVVEEPDVTRQGASAALCGGACEAGTYNACTCGADDPCGWSRNGVCDRGCRAFVEEVEIFEDEDCPSCEVTMCLTGAIGHDSASNAYFKELCDDARIPGRVPDCRGGKCKSTWGNFLHSPKLDLLPGLIDAVDTNNDGVVTNDDEQCAINLVGFSWGGVNAIHLAEAFKESRKVSGSRVMIERLIILDPYQPHADDVLKVPVNVRMARNYRHSVGPPSDCSSYAPLGPYLGLPTQCPSWQDCKEYDYSADPDAWYEVDAGWYQGAKVGHCLVPRVAHEAVIADLTNQKSSRPRPPEVRVKRP